jgi:hypothetical protein
MQGVRQVMWRAIKPYVQGFSIAIPIVLLCWAIASLMEAYGIWSFLIISVIALTVTLGATFKEPRGL